MAATIQGQQTYNQFPAFAQPGQLADLAGAEIQSFPAYEIIQPGRVVCMEAREAGDPNAATLDRIAADLATAGVDFASAKDRNRLIGYAARQLDPPVIEKEAVNAWVGTLIGHEIDDIVHLSAADCLVAYSKLGLEPA